MPSIPDLAERLGDGRVELRLAAERDIPEILIAHQDDRQLYDRLGLERPPSGAELGRAAELADAEREAGTRVELTILEPGSDDCRGRIVVHDLDWEQGQAELDVWLTPQLRGRGLGRGALKLAAQWLFVACGLRRLELLTETDNAAMMRAARAAGFVNEGVRRVYTDERGARVEEVAWALSSSAAAG